MWHCSYWLLEVPSVTLETTSIHSFIPLVPRSNYEVLLRHATYLLMAGSPWSQMVLNWTNLNQIKSNSGESNIYTFHSIHPWRCVLKDQFGTAARKTQPDTYKRDRHINMTVVRTHIYNICVFLSHSIPLSAVNQKSVRTSFKLSHSINTGSIDFFKQLMEAFRAGKLIKIICRSSSFKDSPLVYVELNHAWLENPSIGHRNWLVFLMAFQCFCVLDKESECLWQISCCSSNNPHTESLKTVALCPVSNKYLADAWRQWCVSYYSIQKQHAPTLSSEVYSKHCCV